MTAFFVVVTRSRINFILRSDLFRTLKSRGDRIVVISPFSAEPAFRDEFGGSTVSFEQLEKVSRWLKRITYFRSTAMAAHHPVLKDATRIHDLVTYRYRRVPSWRTAITSAVIRACVFIIPPNLRRSQRWWERLTWLTVSPTIPALFKKYKPSVVLLGSAGAEGEDVPYILAGNRYAIPTVVVDSNIDAATYRYFSAPWRVTYWALFGEPQKREFAELHGIPLSSMVVTGALRYDRYFRGTTAAPIPRAEFCKKIGVDPNKRILVLSPRSPKVFPHNDKLITMFLEEIQRGTYEDVELFVRFDPTHPIDIYPKEFLQSFRWERAEDAPDEDHIASLLQHCHAFFGLGATTLAIEACALGKPVAWIGFNGPVAFNDPSDYSRLQYDVAVFQRLIRTGGIPLIENKEQLAAHIRMFLDTPDSNKERRDAMLKQEYANYGNGKAGERIVEFIDSVT